MENYHIVDDGTYLNITYVRNFGGSYVRSSHGGERYVNVSPDKIDELIAALQLMKFNQA